MVELVVMYLMMLFGIGAADIDNTTTDQVKQAEMAATEHGGSGMLVTGY